MAGNTVGQARIELVPDLSGFHRKASREIRQMPDLSAVVKFTPSLTGFKREAQREINSLGPLAVKVEAHLDLDVVQMRRDIAQASRDLNPIKLASELDLNPGHVRREVDALAATLPKITLQVEADTTLAAAQIGLLAAASHTVTINVDVDSGGALAQLGAIGGASTAAAASTKGIGLSGIASGASGVLGLTPMLGLIGLIAGAAGLAAGAVGILGIGILAMGVAVLPALGVVALGFEGIKTAAGEAKVGFDQLKATMTDTMATSMKAGFQDINGILQGIVPQAQNAGNAVGFLFNDIMSLIRNDLMGELRTMMDGAAEFIRALAPGLGDMTIGFMNLGASFAASAGAIGAGLGGMLGQLGTVLDRLTNLGIIPQLLDAVGPVLFSLGGVVAGLVEGLAIAGQAIIPILAPLLDTITSILPAVGTALGAVGLAFGQILQALLPVLVPIVGLLTTLAPVIAAALIPVATLLVQIVSELALVLGPVLAQIIPVIGTILQAVGNVLLAMVPVVGALLTALMPLVPVFGAIIVALGDVLIMLMPVLTQIVVALAPLLPVVANAVLQILHALMPLMPVLAELLGAVLPFLAQVITAVLVPAIQFLAWFVIPVLVAVIDGAIIVIRRIITAVEMLAVNFFRGIEALKAFGGWMVKMVDAATVKGQELLQWFQDLPGRISGWLGDAGSWLVDTGRNIIDGLVNGIKSAGSAVKDAILSLVPDAIEGPIKKALGIESPSKLMAEVGLFTGQGVAVGLEASIPDVEASALKVAAAADHTTRPGASKPSPVPEIPGVAPKVTVTPTVDPTTVDAVALAESVKMALETVAAPAWETYGQAVQTVQTGVLTPSMSSIAGQALSTSATISASMAGMDAATYNTGNVMAGVTAGTITPALAGMNASVVQTGQVLAGVTTATIIPAWTNTGAQIRNVQAGPMETAFRETRASVQYTAGTFGPAADNIAVQWGRLREGTAAPVRWSIQNVFNDGVVGSWNAVSELLGTKKMGAYPIRFATGGAVPGQGNTDKVPALLMPGEFVLRKSVVSKLGTENLARINEGKDPQGALPDMRFADVARRFAAGGVVKGTPAWEQIKRGYDWARSRHGRPYVLGGSANGGGGTDCSGFMSGIANVIGGGDGRRQWATMSFNGGGNAQQRTGPQGFVAGLAAGFSIGVKNGGPAGGHTAGTIGGLEGMPPVNVESGGSPSRVKFGVGAVGADHSQFPTKYHLPVIGERFQTGGGGGGGSMVSMAEMVAEKTDPIWKKVGDKVAATKFPGMTQPVPKGYMTSFKGAQDKKIKELADAASTFSDPGGAGVQRWRPLVETLLKRYGHSLSNTDLTLRRMNQESGGNPRAINNWDSNAKAGIPSKGLMQVIDPTFQANRDPALSPDIWDPMANVASSMRYAMKRYGSLAAAYNRSGGYDAGGWLDPGISTIYNGFTKPEAILSPAESERFVNIADAFIDQNMAGGSFVGQHVENQYLTDVDEVQAQSRRGVRRAMKEAGIR